MSRIVFPAEWDTQAAVMLTWPHEQTDWVADFADVEETFFEIALHISKAQGLIINCQSFDALERIAEFLSENKVAPERVGLFCTPSNNCWSRDHGPLTVYVDDFPVLMDFDFNAWGNKFLHDKDQQITTTLHEMGAFAGADIHHVDYVLEGGAIDSDSKGTILASTQCLLNPNRNSDATKAKIENGFNDWFGATRILWLDHGHLAGDLSDCHIDKLARFCNATTLCYNACQDEKDENHHSLSMMERQLKSFKTLSGAPYHCISLPLPTVFSSKDGRRLPASYTGFQIINNSVLVPVFATCTDQQALQTLAVGFPEHSIIPVNCLSLLENHGSLHRATMQLPEGTLD